MPPGLAGYSAVHIFLIYAHICKHCKGTSCTHKRYLCPQPVFPSGWSEPSSINGQCIHIYSVYTICIDIIYVASRPRYWVYPVAGHGFYLLQLQVVKKIQYILWFYMRREALVKHIAYFFMQCLISVWGSLIQNCCDGVLMFHGLWGIEGETGWPQPFLGFQNLLLNKLTNSII